MEPTRSELVTAYWTYKELSGGNREERLASTDYFWAWEAVSDAVCETPGCAVDLFDDLLCASTADPIAIGAGPLEELLSGEAGADVAGAVAERCRVSDAWRAAVAVVWLDGSVRDRLPMLAPYLRQP